MKYSFSINKYFDTKSGLQKSNPLLRIDNQEEYGCYFIDEINHIGEDIGNLKEIVRKLEDLLDGKIDFFEGFGYEIYMIECTREQAKVINIFEDNKLEAKIPTQDIYELMRDWQDYLIQYHENKNDDKNKLIRVINDEVLPLSHTFQNENYELKFIGSKEPQPGLIIDEAKLDTQNKTLSIESFELGLKKFSLYRFGYKNWLFIQEQANAFLINLLNGEKYKQVTWFRENGRNSKDNLIGNYFSKNLNVTVNKKSSIVFDLNTESKQTIKFKNLLGEISWAYLLDKKTLRVFLNDENKMACYNIQKESFFDIKDIVDQKNYSEINLIHCIDYIEDENNHITSFMLVKNKMSNETFQFTENKKLNN